MVFLIQLKVGINPLNNQQLVSHAVKWLGISATLLPSRLISLDWINVISAIQEIESAKDGNDINQQERILLAQLMDFIGYYGYRKFDGIIWTDLRLPPKFFLRKHRIGNIKRKGFLQFSDLLSAPCFAIMSNPLY